MARPTYKVVLVGTSGVGKSRLLERYMRNEFSEHASSTFGVDFASKTVDVAQDTPVELKIWDTAGQAKYRAITNAYYSSTTGVLLVYDVTNGDSFLECEEWLAEIRAFTSVDVPVLLVGNKADLAEAGQRVVQQADAAAFAAAHNLAFVETSARTGFAVAAAFELIAGAMYTLDLERREQDAETAAASSAAASRQGHAEADDGAFQSGAGSVATVTPSRAGGLRPASASSDRKTRGCWRACALRCCGCCCECEEAGEASALLLDKRGRTGPTRSPSRRRKGGSNASVDGAASSAPETGAAKQ